MPRVALPDGTIAYLATRHADVSRVFTDRRFSRAAAAGPRGPEWELGSLADDSLLGMDPPLHTRVRRVVANAFTARRVEGMRAEVARLVDGMIDRLEAAGPPADLIEHVSAPLPIHVISRLFGVAEEDRDRVREWSDALVGDWRADPGPPRAALAAFGELVERRRADPGDDLMSALVAAWDEQDDLTERQLVSVTAGLLAGGHESTTNQINLFLLVLARNPDQLAGLRADDPGAVARAVEELTRYVQLGSTGILLPRVTTEEVELGGVTIPAGSAVLPGVVSANRDAAVFDAPDRLDLDRHPNPHIGYGVGPHHCIGAALARMELQEALGALLRRLPGLRPAVPESELRFKPGVVVRSLEELPVTWDR
ncbi:cytochrome P450 [Saccharothrix syringae]|uniref:Cytochrome P450 n=1 Tax=Saccharothrix syringae TaxID=103733 RepID=A0A5Q0H4W2_SACSY|nr:cytochrome P450 [Saccharothrix syringae]QFZ21237.1 cytochrome P450 [Saccharothrix syringae]